MNTPQTNATHSSRYSGAVRSGIGNDSVRNSYEFRSGTRAPFTFHCLLFTVFALLALTPRAEAVEGTNTGGYVTTYTDAGGTNWIYHVFTNAGASGMKFRATAAGGTVELLVVAGGGSGGGSQYDGGAGGGGGLIYTNYTVTHNTDYAVSVGPGGSALAGNSTAQGNTGQNSSFGSSLTAYGGGGGGNYSSGAGKNGGSGGGGAGNNCGSYTNGGSPTAVTPTQGNKGGNGYPSSGALGSGGGGGAGYAGGNGTSSAGGNGGDGLYFAAFTNWGDTSNPGWFAGGGGGGVYSGTSPGTGGKGGGGVGGTNGTGVAGSGGAGQPNTGGGGGGPKSHNTSAYGGAGGSGIVILRYQSLPPVLPASGGDILYPTNLNGTLYGVHIFTNTVGTNYFTPTKALGSVEYLVIGGGGGGGGGRGGGGGAGGYRCSVQGELSGSNSTAEAVYPVSAGVAYPVVVGAGGGGGSDTGYKGGDSWFTNIVATGGGGGKERANTSRADGGSGGGGGYAGSGPIPGGSGTTNQGFSGGKCGTAGPDGYAYSDGGGGGGAGSAGTQGRDGANNAGYNIDPWGSGGTGLVSSITGAAVKRAGGGGGNSVTWGVATNYGGGVDVTGRRDGATSTGGGGAATWAGTGGSGGSGVVIVRYVIPSPSITVTNTAYDFGNVLVNQTGTWSYTASGDALTNNLTVSVPSSSPFTIATNGGTYGNQVILTTNAFGSVSNTVNIRFIPPAGLSYSATLTNSSPGAADKTILLTGAGFNPSVPSLIVAPVSLDFGNVITNKTSSNLMFTVTGTNLTGNVTVTAPSDYFKVSTNGSDFASSVTLATNASGGIDITNIYVHLTASGGAIAYGGSTTNSSAAAVDRTVTVTGNGVVQALSVTPGTLAFGYVLTNTTSATTNYTVSGSNLEANVTVTAPSPEFTVSTNLSGSYAQSCTVEVAGASAPSGATLAPQTIYVRFTPGLAQLYSGNIAHSSVGAASTNKAVTGNGANSPATVSVTVPAPGQVFNSGDAISLTGTVTPGNAPYTVRFYTNCWSGGYGQAGADQTGAGPGFTVSLGVLPAGTYHVYATVTDVFSSVTYTSAANTFVVQPPVPAGMLASGGDMTSIITNYANTSSQTVYGVHQFTNVGAAAFVPIRDLTNIEYLVIGGGGGGGPSRGGGGGAGGYRCSVQGELSGSNSPAEAVYPVSPGVAYPVVVGGGGAGGGTTGGKGGDSWFTNIVSTGGGGGKERNSAIPEPSANGGSGGGGGYDSSGTDRTKGASGTAGQGYPGGNAGGTGHSFAYSDGGGGGGAGGAGENGSDSATQDSGGGAGLESSITGVTVKRAGGGQGAYGTGTSPGKAYGGGDQSATNGVASTGGGGAAQNPGAAGNGGSGIVIVRYVIQPPTITVTNTSYDFGNVNLNQTGTWSYTVSGDALTNNLTVSVPSSSPFTIATNGGTYGNHVILTTNAFGSVSNTTINIRFIPPAGLPYSATLTNSSPGAADKTIQLAGAGFNPSVPTLTVAPVSLGFGNVITNKTSGNLMFTVTGTNLTDNVTVSAPSDYFKVSTNGTDFEPSVTLATNAIGGLDITNIYVQLTASGGAISYGGSITNSSSGAVDKTVTVAGNGVVQTLSVTPGTLAFGYVLTNTTSATTNYTVSGSNLEANVTVTAPSAEFTVSTNLSGSYAQSCTVDVAGASAPSGATLAPQTIYVRFTPGLAQLYSGNITHSSVGAAAATKAVSGNGMNPPATVSVTVPEAGQVYATGDVVSITGTVTPGNQPYTVKFYTNRWSGGYGQAGSVQTGPGPEFTVSLGVLPAGTYHAYATVTDVLNSVTYTSATNTFMVQAPAPAGMLASGGDVTSIITNYAGTSSQTVYGIHQFTNVGSAYLIPSRNLNLEYLVIGGGGGAGPARGGGGGAGGYRCSVQGELCGSNSPAEAVYPVSSGVAYPVGVGAGGAGGGTTGGQGGDSWFTNIVSTGGGGGKERNSAIPEPKANGGSGGGGGYDSSGTDRTKGGSGMAGQGYPGGNAGGTGHGFAYSDGGGGGGAGGAGENGSDSATQDSGGGAGLESSITGVAVKRAGGGQGAYGTGTSPGKAYGGGDQSATNGVASTGGGGAAQNPGAAGNGGSGIVIVRYDMTPAIAVSATSHGFGSTLVGRTGTWSYTVSGDYLASNLTVSTPSAAFLISTDNVNYGISPLVLATNATGTVPASTIYIRFIPAAGQSYSGTITNAGAGPRDQWVTLTGTGVVQTLAVSPAALASFGNAITSRTASITASYTVSGSNLMDSVTVRPPSGMFLVSTNSSSDFAGTLMLTPTVGSTQDLAGATLTNTTVYVRFSPSSAGSHSGAITNSSLGASDQLVAVNGTGVVQGVSIVGGPFEFGNVITNRSSISSSYTVSGSNLTDLVTVRVPSAMYWVSTNGTDWAGSLPLTPSGDTNAPAGATLSSTVWVKFAPTSAGAYGGAVTNSSTSASDKLVSVNGTGVVQGVSVSTNLLAFANVLLGRSVTNNYLVAGSNLSAGVVVGAPTGYQVSTNTGLGFGNSVTLVPTVNSTNDPGGATLPDTTVWVTFAPVSTTPYDSSVTNSSLSALDKLVSVTGTGVAVGISVSGGPFAFGNVITNKVSTHQSYTVSGSNLVDSVRVRTPSAAFQISTNSGSDFGTSVTLYPAGDTNAAGGADLAEQTVYVRFAPTTAGSFGGSITNTTFGPGDTMQTVSGTGVVQGLRVSPSALAFGLVPFGVDSNLTYTLAGSNLGAVVVVSAPTGFRVSTNGTAFADSVTVTPAGDLGAPEGVTLPDTVITVKFTQPQEGVAYSGSITNTTVGAVVIDPSVSGRTPAVGTIYFFR